MTGDITTTFRFTGTNEQILSMFRLLMKYSESALMIEHEIFNESSDDYYRNYPIFTNFKIDDAEVNEDTKDSNVIKCIKSDELVINCDGPFGRCCATNFTSGKHADFLINLATAADGGIYSMSSKMLTYTDETLVVRYDGSNVINGECTLWSPESTNDEMPDFIKSRFSFKQLTELLKSLKITKSELIEYVDYDTVSSSNYNEILAEIVLDGDFQPLVNSLKQIGISREKYKESDEFKRTIDRNSFVLNLYKSENKQEVK